MRRILVLCYSQSGDVRSVRDALLETLRAADAEIHFEEIRPVAEYPYPWKSLPTLFSVFPECFLGPDTGIQPLSISPDDRFDLVILCWQVWHLRPSLPIQSFFTRSEYVRLLADTPVVTLLVSRNMWQSASEAMKGMLAEAGARHRDAMVITHQGPPFTTFVSVPRALLWGKRDRLWGIFPPAELSRKDLDRAADCGRAIASQLHRLDDPAAPPFFQGMNPVRVNKRYVIPEKIGFHVYQAAASVVAGMGRRWGTWGRKLGLYLFILWLLTAILIGIPVSIIFTYLLYPLTNPWLTRYARKLAEPSGS